MTQKVGGGPRLSAAEKRERDARMQHRLNVGRMARVYRAALNSGWFQMPLSDFVQVPVEDYGEAMFLAYPDGSRYAVTDFDPDIEVVTLRRVA